MKWYIITKQNKEKYVGDIKKLIIHWEPGDKMVGVDLYYNRIENPLEELKRELSQAEDFIAKLKKIITEQENLT